MSGRSTPNKAAVNKKVKKKKQQKKKKKKKKKKIFKTENDNTTIGADKAGTRHKQTEPNEPICLKVTT